MGTPLAFLEATLSEGWTAFLMLCRHPLDPPSTPSPLLQTLVRDVTLRDRLQVFCLIIKNIFQNRPYNDLRTFKFVNCYICLYDVFLHIALHRFKFLRTSLCGWNFIDGAMRGAAYCSCREPWPWCWNDASWREARWRARSHDYYSCSRPAKTHAHTHAE